MRPSSEALVISAIINSQDLVVGQAYGLDPDMFIGYQPEYRWLTSYQLTYSKTPSWEALQSKFPAFPKNDHDDVAFAADEVRINHSQRMMKKAVRSAAQSIAEGDYEEAYLALSAYSPAVAQKPLQNALSDLSFLDTYHEKPEVVSVPWRPLQDATGGMRKGDLWFMAARPSQGKSWNLVMMARDALLAGHKVLYYTLEMTKEQILVRVHVALGAALGLDVDHIAMRDRIFDLIAYKKLINRIRDEVPGVLHIVDAASGKVTPGVVAAQSKDVDLTLIDYAGLMASGMGKRAVEDWRFMATISNELKEIAVANDTRILAASQINRDGENNASRKPPKLKNLAQSDALGQDGDVIITHKRHSKSSQIFSIEKNRHGISGELFYTRFLPNEGNFSVISRDHADDLRDREDSDD